MDGELTLEMLDADGTPSRLDTAMTRAFHELDQRRIAELLDAAEAAEFFTRPAPAIGTDPGSVLWRVRIVDYGRSRELVIPDRNAGPELERLARAARACLRDRQVVSWEAMTVAEWDHFVAGLTSFALGDAAHEDQG